MPRLKKELSDDESVELEPTEEVVEESIKPLGASSNGEINVIVEKVNEIIAKLNA